MKDGGIGVLGRVYDAWNRRDRGAVPALFSPDAEFRTSGDYPGISPSYRGPEGIRAFMHDFFDIWETIRIEPRRYEQVGDRVVTFFHFVGTGRDGVPVEREGGHIARIEDGVIADLQACGSWARVREDAGLEE